jgi:hypothetical protein
MDCPNAQHLLAYRRPGGPAELAPEDAAALDRHLAGCPSCAAAVRRQDSFDAALASAMRSVSAPIGFRERLITDALARRGAAWRRTVYQYATAASILVMLGLTAAGFGFALRPAFDTGAVADEFARTSEDPERAVRAWLDRQGLPVDLPYDFDYRHYRQHGFETVEGRAVPVVLFGMPPQPGGFRPEAAKVFVVRASRFKIDEATFRATVNSFCTVEVVPDNGRGVSYVILYTTPKLGPFLKPTPHQQLSRANTAPWLVRSRA